MKAFLLTHFSYEIDSEENLSLNINNEFEPGKFSLTNNTQHACGSLAMRAVTERMFLCTQRAIDGFYFSILSVFCIEGNECYCKKNISLSVKGYRMMIFRHSLMRMICFCTSLCALEEQAWNHCLFCDSCQSNWHGEAIVSVAHLYELGVRVSSAITPPKVRTLTNVHIKSASQFYWW